MSYISPAKVHKSACFQSPHNSPSISRHVPYINAQTDPTTDTILEYKHTALATFFHCEPGFSPVFPDLVPISEQNKLQSMQTTC